MLHSFIKHTSHGKVSIYPLSNVVCLLMLTMPVWKKSINLVMIAANYVIVIISKNTLCIFVFLLNIFHLFHHQWPMHKCAYSITKTYAPPRRWGRRRRQQPRQWRWIYQTHLLSRGMSAHNMPPLTEYHKQGPHPWTINMVDVFATVLGMLDLAIPREWNQNWRSNCLWFADIWRICVLCYWLHS